MTFKTPNHLFHKILGLLVLSLFSAGVNAADGPNNLDAEGFSLANYDVSGLSGCYKPVGKNAGLFQWSHLVLENDPELDCSQDRMSCAGSITLFDKAGAQAQAKAWEYRALANNLALGMGMLSFGKENEGYLSILIPRFKLDANNLRIVAFEGLIRETNPEPSNMAAKANQLIRFESCSNELLSPK